MPESNANLAARFADALSWQQRGDPARADAICDALICAEPRHADAWHLRGLLAFQTGQFERSVAFIGGSLRINPNQAAAEANLGSALLQLKRASDSLRHFDRALALQPDNPTTLFSRATAYLEDERHIEAIDDLRQALRLMPKFGMAWVTLGRALLKIRQLEEALAAFDSALAVESRDTLALQGRGDALFELERFEESLRCYDEALRRGVATVELLNNRGNALLELSRRPEARAAFEHALLVDPNSAQAHNNLGNLLLDLLKIPEAIAAYQSALARQPQFATALDNLALAQLMMERPEQAAETYAALVAVQPDYPMARGNLLYSRLMCCAWDGFGAARDATIAEVAAAALAQPFAFLSVSDSPELQLQCARNFVRSKSWGRREVHREALGVRRPGPLRVAYVSGDLRDHAVAWLLAGVLEHHDRTKIESFGVGLRPGDNSEIGRRIRSAFDHWIDATDMGDEQLVRMLRGLEVDIAVDLMGYTRWSRPAVFAQRAAPIQVEYLGYAGTSALPAMDYLIADSVVVSKGAEISYSEAIARLPHCFLPADDRREIGAAPSRKAAGLPETGLVFCAFTNAYKITPDVFGLWMRLLRESPACVLWMRGMGAIACGNLQREAAARGVDPKRLVFAPWSDSMSEHLGRQTLADLYLDTMPYNAHSTVCDALWAGVPVLTCAGRGFASRVAASALLAMGLPELVAQSSDDYFDRALALARSPERLSALRQRVGLARHRASLFQTERYTRGLETAFEQMWVRHEAGLPAVSFEASP